MAFPIGPIDQQVHIANDVKWIYDIVTNTWNIVDDLYSTELNLDSEVHDRRAGDSDIMVFMDSEYRARKDADSEIRIQIRDLDSDTNNGHLSTIKQNTPPSQISWDDANSSSINNNVWYLNTSSLGTGGGGVNGIHRQVVGSSVIRESSSTGTPITIAVLWDSGHSTATDKYDVYLTIVDNGTCVVRERVYIAGNVTDSLDNKAESILKDRWFYSPANNKWYQVDLPQTFETRSTLGWRFYHDINVMDEFSWEDFVYADDSEYITREDRDLLISDSLRNLYQMAQGIGVKTEKDLHDLYAQDSDIVNGSFGVISDQGTRYTLATAFDASTWQINGGSFINYQTQVVNAVLGDYVTTNTNGPATFWVQFPEGANTRVKLMVEGYVVFSQAYSNFDETFPETIFAANGNAYSMGDQFHTVTTQIYKDVVLRTLDLALVDSDYESQEHKDRMISDSLNLLMLKIQTNEAKFDSDEDRIVRYNADSDIETNGILFTNDPTLGRLSWNELEQTLDLSLANGSALQLGQEILFYAKATEDILNGEVVMFAGAQGDHLLVSKADPSAPGFIPEWVIGLATQDVLTNDFGYITQQGKVRDLDTSAFAEGTLLYMDHEIPGRLLDSEPSWPHHSQLIGTVTRSHANHGTIYVRPTHNPDLGEIHDVRITEPDEGTKDGQVIMWDSDTNLWENQNINTDYGNF